MDQSATGTRTGAYKVVVNSEGQYSLWLADRANPKGWLDVGKAGSREDCLAFIKETWIDMRPASLRADEK